MKPDPLASFTPQVRDWFLRAFAEPTAAQASAIATFPSERRVKEARRYAKGRAGIVALAVTARAGRGDCSSGGPTFPPAWSRRCCSRHFFRIAREIGLR